MRSFACLAAFQILGMTVACSAQAQESNDALARQLSNPISSLISVPFQFNADYGAGEDGDGAMYTLNIQPVIPFRLNDEWNVISRTVLPVVGRENVFPSDSSKWGVSDTLQSFFLSPDDPGPHGLIWGVGPVFLLPTASDDLLGTEKWGIGPTAVALTQRGPWTLGALANHIWSFAGNEDRDDVNQSYVQPFVAYSIGRGQTIQAGIDATYDWEHERWNAPVNLNYSRVFAVGEQRMSFSIGGRYFLESPEGGAAWGMRTSLTFLFPRPH
jgi:hypothetical protein